MSQAKAIGLRALIMCLVIVPCWVLHRELAASPENWRRLYLVFFFLGPIVAGVYAGISGGKTASALSAIALASALLTLLYAALWMTDVPSLQQISLMGQLFSTLLGLLLVGAVPAMGMRVLLRASSDKSSMEQPAST